MKTKHSKVAAHYSTQTEKHIQRRAYMPHVECGIRPVHVHMNGRQQAATQDVTVVFTQFRTTTQAA